MYFTVYLLAPVRGGLIERVTDEYAVGKWTGRRCRRCPDPLTVRVYTEEVELLAVYVEQLGRWRSGPLTVDQRLEVERLSGQLAHNRDVDAAILTLADNLKATTIDAILAKSDLELGLEVFTDRSPLFPRDPPRQPQP